MKNISPIVFFLFCWVWVGKSLSAQNPMADSSREAASAARYWINLGDSCLHQGHYAIAEAAADSAIAIQSKFLSEKHPDCADAWFLKGKVILDLGFQNQARPFFEKSLNINTLCFGETSDKAASALSKIGRCYLYDSQVELAINTLEKALLIQQKNLPPNHPDIAETLQILGSCHRNLKKYDNAIRYYKKVLDIRFVAGQEISDDVAWCYSDIGQLYILKEEYDKAFEYFQKENTIMLKLGGDSLPDYGYTCNDLGRIYLCLKDLPASIRWQKKALAIFRKASKIDNGDIATILRDIGRTQLENGDFAEAISSFEEDQRILLSLSDAEQEYLHHAYAGKGESYRRWYLKTGLDSLLDKSRQNFLLAEKGIQSQIKSKTLPEAQWKFLQEAIPVYEKAISSEILFHQQQKLAGIPEKAWQLSESMHGNLLFAATQEANARHFAGIPDADLAKDSVLQADLTNLKKKKQSCLEEQQLALTDPIMLELNAQIAAKKEACARLEASFEQRYPEYYQLKFDLNTVSIKAAQQLLSPSKTLLEYFSGDSSIFIFIVNTNESRIFEIKRDFPLNEWTAAMLDGITGYHAAKEKPDYLYEQTVRTYADYAQKLYEKLLAPVSEYLSPELIIIPSEELANIPFEALLSHKPKQLNNFKTFPFAARQYAIHYAYSATMWQQMRDQKHRKAPEGELLALAPFFAADTFSLAKRLSRDTAIRLGFSVLPHSGEEVLRVKTRLGGRSQVLLGAAATKAQFLQMAGNFQVLHLATHGKANHKAGDFSFLAFALEDDSLKSGLLSVGELYNCTLNADMVVLSACETSIGETHRGEGVMSLARAFAFAGAKSIVSSLWKVSDKSTMELMDYYYAELVAGEAKNVALSNAKRLYLERYPGIKSHPFYWAGFVAVGDMGPLKK